jgi:hypothetical protein
MKLNGNKLNTMAGNNSFLLSNQPEVSMDVFVTEKPSVLYVSFTIELPCEDGTSDKRTGARIIVHGEGTYDAGEKRFTELADRGEKLIYQLPDGTEKTLENHVLMVGNVFIGHRTVEHSIKHKV